MKVVKQCSSLATIQAGEVLLCAIGVSSITGALFGTIGFLLFSFGCAIENPVDYLLTGTVCGFVGSALGMVTAYGPVVKDMPSPSMESTEHFAKEAELSALMPNNGHTQDNAMLTILGSDLQDFTHVNGAIDRAQSIDISPRAAAWLRLANATD